MPQVTIYLDAETEARMREAAEAAGLSYSKWVARLIAERTQREWPPRVAELAGAWADEPELERPPQGRPTGREPF